jgi:hypothetical protein|tara:strand:+ start:2023 stop:2577 length:555 start_codon:yes stop_codon:yes gene_type:complete
MKQTILSQIDIYEGEIKMPKFFDINRSELKADILESYVTQNVRSNNKLDYASMDYNLPYSKSLHMLKTYIVEHSKLHYNHTLVPLESFGNILNSNQQSFSRTMINPIDLLHSPDYTMMYGVDVQPNSSSLVIEYNNNRKVNNKRFFKIKNNCYIIFPSVLQSFITANNSSKQNIFLTVNFERFD